MSRNQIIGRLEKLEQRQPANSYNGADRFIWNGPKDDAAMAEAERAADANGKLLIVRRIVDPMNPGAREYDPYRRDEEYSPFS
jgi:hypothetical protein